LILRIFLIPRVATLYAKFIVTSPMSSTSIYRQNPNTSFEPESDLDKDTILSSLEIYCLTESVTTTNKANSASR
jgi:hypothetical protein